MQYEEALKVWGAKRLNEVYNNGRWPIETKPEDVIVEMNFNEGYACCGGSDPDCYCSFAESPSAEVVIRSTATSRQTTIPHYAFDFARILGEIVEAADGTVTRE